MHVKLRSGMTRIAEAPSQCAPHPSRVGCLDHDENFKLLGLSTLTFKLDLNSSFQMFDRVRVTDVAEIPP